MQNNKIRCSEHPDACLISDWRAGDIICSECGLVILDRVIDVTAEWRTFSNDDNKSGDRSRVGQIENKNAEIVFEKRANSTFLDYIDRLNLDKSIKNSAFLIFEKIVDAGLNKGRSIELIVAVCIYIACKEMNVPRTFKELESSGKTSALRIQKCYSAITAVLKVKDNLKFSLPITNSNQHIVRLCAKLNLKIGVEKLA